MTSFINTIFHIFVNSILIGNGQQYWDFSRYIIWITPMFCLQFLSAINSDVQLLHCLLYGITMWPRLYFHWCGAMVRFIPNGRYVHIRADIKHTNRKALWMSYPSYLCLQVTIFITFYIYMYIYIEIYLYLVYGFCISITIHYASFQFVIIKILSQIWFRNISASVEIRPT